MIHSMRVYYLAAVLQLCLSVSPALASPFSELIVFGDSLSDIGNVADKSLGIQPGRFYYEDRFSNGLVYADLFATHLDLAPLAPSALGGTNYAHGGAQTSGTGFFAGLVIDDLDDQVDDFIAAGPADPNALVVILAGANDLFNGQTNPSIPVGNIVGDIQRLIAAQTQNLLVMNLPPLGTTPRFNQNPTAAATMNALTFDFNSQLSSALDSLEIAHPDVDFYRLDVAALITEGINNPTAFGLTNVTDPAAPGLESGQLFYNTNNIVDNPNAYLFWDEIHPTATAHAALAERALAAIRTPADFDFDGNIDIDDLLQWQDDFGSTSNSDADQDGDSDGADFLTWQQFYETQSAPHATIVPEPTTAVLLTCLAISSILTRRRITIYSN